jgi:hypothetical protein
MTNLPIIIDNLFDEKVQSEIEDALFDCYWNFNVDVTYGNNIQSNKKYRKFLDPFDKNIHPGFRSNLLANRKFFNLFYPSLLKACNYVGFEIEKVGRCVAGIHYLAEQNSKICNIHVNRKNPHLVFLYYVTDADGDTILYDKTINDLDIDNIQNKDIMYKFNIKKKISPKKGRVLFFNGENYHSSSTPTKNIRCIITLDLFGKFVDGDLKFNVENESNCRSHFKYQ